jgi:putative flippase GtrA
MSGGLPDGALTASQTYSEWTYQERNGHPYNEGRSPPERRARGRHRAPRGGPSSRIRALVAEHGTRFASFSAIGGFVFLLGLGFQALLVQMCHVGSLPSYLAQGFLSIEVSFLLSYYWTWRDIKSPFWRTCGKFNVQKILATIANVLVYTGLIAVHINYLVANIITTIIFTAINYVFGNRWTFVPSEGKKHCPPPLA